MDAGMLDKLDMMLALAGKDCGNDDVELLNRLDASSVMLDKGFHRKKARIVQKHKNGPTARVLKKGLLGAAMVLMIIMSIGFTTIMAVSPMRKAVFEVIVEWHENYITLHYENANKDTVNANGEAQNTTMGNTETPPIEVPVITPPTTIKEVRKPTNLADNIIEDVIIQNKVYVCIDYYKDEELAYTFTQMIHSESDMYIDNDGITLDTIDIGGKEGTLIQHTTFAGISIIWSDGEYIYQVITQSASLEELIALCRSVK